MLTWEKSPDQISIVFKVNLVWWDVGQVFEPSSGAFAFFSVERRQLLSNADGVQSQLLSSGDKKGKKRENNPQSLWLIWQHHLKYSIYHRLAMSDRFSTAIQLKCVGGRRKHFKKRDLQSGVSDCREGRGGGWAQVRANLQSNKLGESTWEPFWDNGALLAGRCAWQPGQTYTLGTPSIPGIPGTAHSIPGVPGILYLVYYQAGTTPGLLVRPWFLVPHSGGVCDITFSRFLNKLWVSFHVIS